MKPGEARQDFCLSFSAARAEGETWSNLAMLKILGEGRKGVDIGIVREAIRLLMVEA